MVTLTDIQLLQLNKLNNKLSSNLTLVAAVCSLKHKLNNKLLLVLEAILSTVELQLQLSSSSSNNNKQQQDSRKFLAPTVQQRFLVLFATKILHKFLALARAEALWQRFPAIMDVIVWLKQKVVIIIGTTVGTTIVGIVMIGIGVTLATPFVTSVPLYILLLLLCNSNNSSSSWLENDSLFLN